MLELSTTPITISDDDIHTTYIDEESGSLNITLGSLYFSILVSSRCHPINNEASRQYFWLKNLACPLSSNVRKKKKLLLWWLDLWGNTQHSTELIWSFMTMTGVRLLQSVKERVNFKAPPSFSYGAVITRQNLGLTWNFHQSESSMTSWIHKREGKSGEK